MLDLTSDSAGDASLPRADESAPVNDQALLDAYSNAVIGVTERVGPAVVRVETGPKVKSLRERGGLGSGIVISPDGFVLTNSHVVGSSKEIRLRDIEGFVTDAHVLGTDPDTDLALLRADGAIVSPEQLLESVWDANVDPFTNTVRMTVMKLRRKLGEPAVIETVPGAGYRL